jgi:hypothetical protein
LTLDFLVVDRPAPSQDPNREEDPMSYPGQNSPGQNYSSYGGPQGSYGNPRTNPLAITSLCLGIAQIVLGLIIGFFNLILGIGALVCGIIALNQIKTRGERGRGMAIAGIVISVVGFVLLIILVIAAVSILHHSGT